jgi:alpha-beta hydrolase superfamily lysophospholipase
MFAVAFVAANVFAIIQSRAMTQFTGSGRRTRAPQHLSTLEKIKVLVCGVDIPRPVNSLDPSSIGLDFETFRFATTDHLQLEAWRIPAMHPKGVMLLFHGYSGHKGDMLTHAALLHEMGFDVVMVDFRGGGGSDGNYTTLGMREGDDVAAAADFVGKKWPSEPQILYGQSMGSVAILRAVGVLHTAPRAIIVECPYDRILSTVAHRFNAMGLPAFPLAHMLIFWGGVQRGYWPFQLDAVEYAKQVRCPVLYLRGEHDPYVTNAEAHAVFDVLGGPKRYVEITGVGHESYPGANPVQWRGAIVDFLNAFAPDAVHAGIRR